MRSDSAFLSAGSSTESSAETQGGASRGKDSSPMSDVGSDVTNVEAGNVRARKRQSSDSSQNSEVNPASPDSSGSVNYAFNQLNVSLQDEADKDAQPAKVDSRLGQAR